MKWGAILLGVYTGLLFGVFATVGAMALNAWLVLLFPIFFPIAFIVGAVMSRFILEIRSVRARALVYVSLLPLSVTPFVVAYVPYKVQIERIPIPPGVASVRKSISWAPADDPSFAALSLYLGRVGKNTQEEREEYEKKEKEILQFYQTTLSNEGWMACAERPYFEYKHNLPQYYVKDGYRIYIPSLSIDSRGANASEWSMAVYLERGGC